MNAKAEVITLPDAPNVPTVAEGLVHMIERVARDPSVDITRLERLMEMHERITIRNAEQAFNDAMSLAQTDMRPVGAAESNPQTKSKYASYVALDSAIRPIYTKYGFGLTFDTGDGAPEQHVRVICDVFKGAHTRRYHIDMPSDGKGAKGGDVMSRTHATGSAVTYGMRYLLKMIFNIAVGEAVADDDGNAATGPIERLTRKQVDDLYDLLLAKGAPADAFLRWVKKSDPKVERIEDIAAAYYQSCVDAINGFKGAR